MAESAAGVKPVSEVYARRAEARKAKHRAKRRREWEIREAKRQAKKEAEADIKTQVSGNDE